jgi:hypothetical protein
MKNVLIYNSQAAGDCLLGTHSARLYKQYFPNSKICFAVRAGLVPTTSEGELQTSEILEVLALQEHIDYVGQIHHSPSGFSLQLYNSSEPYISFDEIVEQHSWYSDLGIAKSQATQLVSRYPDLDFNSTETLFTVGVEAERPKNYIQIAMSGPLDWNRKTKNERLRLKTIEELKKYLVKHRVDAKIVLLGRDVETGSLLDSLKALNNSHIFIGPTGLHTHAAAGLGVDTITLTSVFPAHYDCPEHYHSGLHQSIKSKNHCGTYECVTEKTVLDTSLEGPKTSLGFWPRQCPYTPNSLSCVTSISEVDILQAFDVWYSTKGVDLWNH